MIHLSCIRIPRNVCMRNQMNGKAGLSFGNIRLEASSCDQEEDISEKDEKNSRKCLDENGFPNILLRSSKKDSFRED
jgi:hypothetical protein